MKTNLPQECKINFFSKIILKIKSFFKKEKNIDNNEKDQHEMIKKNSIINFRDIDSLKYEAKEKNDEPNEYNMRKERKKFLKLLIERPELLERFSVDRLEAILAEYQKENEIKKEN